MRKNILYTMERYVSDDDDNNGNGDDIDRDGVSCLSFSLSLNISIIYVCMSVEIDRWIFLAHSLLLLRGCATFYHCGLYLLRADSSL
tara:strand:+ start:399 stop:659 length:261 start_codon:yes stop_codon:yes gene_type:complete